MYNLNEFNGAIKCVLDIVYPIYDMKITLHINEQFDNNSK